MRLMRSPPSRSSASLLCLAPSLLALLFAPIPCQAGPYPRDDLHDFGFGYLMERQCGSYCGYDNQICCPVGQACYTSADIAGCTAAAGGGVVYFTTTWTSTETFTSTYSSVYPAATAVGSGNCVPPEGSGQIACGTICCANWQYCARENQCMANVGFTTTFTSNGAVYTTAFSPAQRPTSVLSGSTAAAASATASSSANGTDTGGGGGLSGGAIAGIVVGTIFGVGLLLLLCVFCIVRGLWHGVLALLGLGGAKKKEPKHATETITTEERYSRHGSGYSRRDQHGGWFGGGGRPSAAASRRDSEKKKDDGGGKLLGLAGLVGTLMLMLGLRRDKERRRQSQTATSRTSRRTPRSDYGSSYWSNSYTGTTPSAYSSDRRTRDTRRSRRTETTRVSRASSRR